jgi:hypothetical protein
MPSKSAKQHRFMEAIAHNPAFAKKAGVPQSVGKEFAAADKGKKFARGGINKQDTHHGKIDMPFNKLNRYAGMKSGGFMKKGRRYDEGGDVDEGINSYAEPQKSVKTEEGPQRMEEAKTPSRPVAKAKPAAKTSEAKATPSNTTDRGAATSTPARGQIARLAEKSRSMTDEQKEEAGKRTGMALASFAAGPAAGRVGQGLMAARRIRQAREAMKAGEATPRGFEKMSLSERAAATGGMKKGGNVKRFAKGGMTKGVDKKLPTGKQMGNLNMKAGGMKESKAMVGKEVAFMKKKGAPKSMIRHEAAEMGAMKKGGMAKYARGGGIESRGKTKGTIIKMAAGGLAGGHKSADGIAQRGKTKGMKVSMKGGGYC